MIVLRPGLSAQPLTGTPAKPTVSVRFKDGMADVQNEELVTMMLTHPGFNSDFISAEEVLVDPYAGTRQSTEPAHTMTEIKYGHPVSKETKGGSVQLPPEVQKMVTGMAQEMAKQMLPSMVEHTLKGILEAHKGDVAAKKPKGKPGRKPGAKKTVSKVEEAPELVAQASPASTENPASQESVS